MDFSEPRFPKDLKSGNYVICLRVSYNGITITSSRTFSVVKKPLVEVPKMITQPLSLVSVLIAVQVIFTMLIFMLLLYLIYQTIMKPKKRPEKVLEKTAKPEENIEQDIAVLERDHMTYKLKEKLKKKLTILDGSFRSNIISKETYFREKKRIEETLEQL